MAGPGAAAEVPHLPGARVLIVEARFYAHINDLLLTGARRVLEAASAEVAHVVVPGALEIPPAIALAQAAGRFDAYVALGCVIRGETTHYDYVCGESARALMDLAVRDRLAIGYGIVTVNNADQAWARAATDRGDKGGDAAHACLAMVALGRRWKKT